MKRVVMLMLAVSVAQSGCAIAQGTVLLEVLRNRREKKQDTAPYGLKDLDFDVVTLVFSNGLPVAQHSDADTCNGKRQFFVKDATIAMPLKNKKDLLRYQVPDLYSVTMREVTGPNKGVICDITYNPERVIFSHDIYSRVNGKRKLEFCFKDKELLAQIEKRKDIPPILHTALNPTVLIDCGHGGHDPGVIGCRDIAEKNICLAVGKKVADVLKKKGVHAILTRDKDEYLSLEQRVSTIKQLKPQILISIHANASANKRASGVETYYFDRYKCSLRKSEIQVADCIENYQRDLAVKNKQLAEIVQKKVCMIIRDGYEIVDRCAKAEPLHVLMAAEMPSALIEIGFLTNEPEADLLLQEQYQVCMARGISSGVMQFLAQYNVLTSKS